MENTQQSPHVVILPSPGMGHIIPLTEFAKRLVSHHNFSVTFTVPTDGSPSKSVVNYLDALPDNIDYMFLSPVNFDDLPEDAKIETRILLTMTRSMSSLHDALKSITSSKRVVSLVVDLFGTDAFDFADEFKFKPYIFFPPNATVLSFVLHLPKIDETYTCEYRDLPELLKLPGCVPVHGRDLVDPVQDRKNDAYKLLLHQAKRYKLAEGILVNSFLDLEPAAIKALKKGEPGICIPPIYPVGPLIQTGSSNSDDESGCLKWLDSQPRGSVLFVSFGSGGTLSNEQMGELALGLEMSEQRFLWVVRSPSEATNASFFSAQSTSDPFGFLPKGFLGRTKGMGLVVPSWAPQIQVLTHNSTGGFLTHCGWNSTLESIVHGVPLIAWPLYAEQRMNAIMLVEELKIALRPKANENGLIGRNEIARIVKDLMEGEEGKRLRTKTRDLKDAASMVLAENGSSTKSLDEVAQNWKNHKNM